MLIAWTAPPVHLPPVSFALASSWLRDAHQLAHFRNPVQASAERRPAAGSRHYVRHHRRQRRLRRVRFECECDQVAVDTKKPQQALARTVEP